MFDSGAVELRGKWWNGQWGRLGRRDIWLYQFAKGWLVRARAGDSEGHVKEWYHRTEGPARAMVSHLMETGGDGWRDMTSIYRRDE